MLLEDIMNIKSFQDADICALKLINPAYNNILKREIQKLGTTISADLIESCKFKFNNNLCDKDIESFMQRHSGSDSEKLCAGFSIIKAVCPGASNFVVSIEKKMLGDYE